MVDGWELNGEFFPSPEDHQLPLDQRVQSECGSHQVMRRYLSSQNAALVQYRVPRLGQGFSLRVNYVKNPQRNLPHFNIRSQLVNRVIETIYCDDGFMLACNILVEGTSYVYTLSNHGRRLNCSVTTLFPASISLVSLDVGFTNQRRLSRLLSSRRDHLIAHRSTAGEVVHNVMKHNDATRLSEQILIENFFLFTCQVRGKRHVRLPADWRLFWFGYC